MRKSTIHNILFCGTGGQGVLKASEVCGVAAVNAGYRVKKSEVHGMAQRGGSVESHLRFGDDVHSPLIGPGQADFLVAFHDGEAARNRFYLKNDGIDFSLYLEKSKELPDLRFMNTYFLGLLASRLPIELTYWYDAIESVVGRKIEENMNVFKAGVQYGKELLK